MDSVGVQDQTESVPKKVRDELYSAVEDDDIDEVKDIIRQHPRILTSYSNKYFSWYLHLACLNNRVNICQLLLEMGAEVNMEDDTGDTPLHVALSNESDMEIIQTLMSHGADVFKQNHQGSSPFLLSCMLGIFEVFDQILKCKSLPMSHVDIYHQNGLHLLFRSWSELNDDDVFSTSIKLLLRQGIDINNQDLDGRTVLHHASNHRAFEIIPSLIELGADPLKQDNYGESFVTQLEGQISAEELSDLLPAVIGSVKNTKRQTGEGTETDSKESVKQFLNFTNLTGKSLLHIFVSSMDTETLKILLDEGVNVNLQDNLGRTPLHSCSRISHEQEKIEVLLNNGASLDIRDICQRTPLFEVVDPSTAELLLSSGSDANDSDKIGLSPIHLATLDHHKDIVEILVKHGATVNICDNHGNAALHFASWLGFSEMLSVLKNCGADDTLKDNNGYTTHEINQDLEKSNPKKILQTENEAKGIAMGDSQISRFGNKTVDGFAAYLLSTPHLGLLKHVGENAHIKDIIYDLLGKIMTHVVMLDSDFQGRLFMTGSTTEGTRVGEPDELDCLYLLDKVGESCDIFENGLYLFEGFVELKAKSVIHVNPHFFDRNGFLDGENLKDKFSHLVKIAIHQRQMWNANELFEIMVTVDCTKPVINLEIRYIGNYFKSLDISIDIVPAVYIRGWWPSYIKTKSKQLLYDSVEEAGCAILIQNPGIEIGCEDVEHFMRISSSPAEIALFQIFPPYIKRSYALAKILLSDKVSPSISDRGVIEEEASFPADYYISSYMLKNCLLYEVGEMDEDVLAHIFSDNRLTDLNNTMKGEIIYTRKQVDSDISERATHITMNEDIPSLSRITEMMQDKGGAYMYEHDITDLHDTIELTRKIIIRLQACIENGNLPAYFFPSMNILGYEYRTVYGEDVDKVQESIEQKKDKRLEIIAKLLKFLEDN